MTIPSVMNNMAPDSARNRSPGLKVTVAEFDSSPSIFTDVRKSIGIPGTSPFTVGGEGGGTAGCDCEDRERILS